MCQYDYIEELDSSNMIIVPIKKNFPFGLG